MLTKRNARVEEPPRLVLVCLRKKTFRAGLTVNAPVDVVYYPRIPAEITSGILAKIHQLAICLPRNESVPSHVRINQRKAIVAGVDVRVAGAIWAIRRFAG
eukprot:scaffold94095_cov73-Phaeocystis_antarctica.AAC.3